MITLLPTYTYDTMRLMETYLASLHRHDAGVPWRAKVYTDIEGAKECTPLCEKYGIEVVGLDVPLHITGSPKHARLLDLAMERENGLVLTMDTDVLPLRSGWLRELVDWHNEGYALPGIRWPWTVNDNYKKTSIEYRIFDHHNSQNTWVACQLVDVSFIRDNHLLYVNGDDTGFEIIDGARSSGLPVAGWYATRCALPRVVEQGSLDPETERWMCVVYGDAVIHIGAASGKGKGQKRNLDPLGFYDDVIERILTERGAEWIMEHGNNHTYRYDMEDAVAKVKFDVMCREMVKYLETHDRLFDPRGRL